MSRIQRFLVIPALALGFALGSVCVAHAGDDPVEKAEDGARDAWNKTKDGVEMGWEKTKEGVVKGAKRAKDGMGKGMAEAGDGMAKAGESMQE